MSMLPSRALIALASPSFSLADLRSQTPIIIVGVILLAVGTAAVTLFFFRRKSRDFALIYFSIFSILYAVRLLLRMRVVRSLAGVPDSLVDHINLWITIADCAGGSRSDSDYGGFVRGPGELCVFFK